MRFKESHFLGHPPKLEDLEIFSEGRLHLICGLLVTSDSNIKFLIQIFKFLLLLLSLHFCYSTVFETGERGRGNTEHGHWDLKQQPGGRSFTPPRCLHELSPGVAGETVRGLGNYDCMLGCMQISHMCGGGEQKDCILVWEALRNQRKV